MGIQGLLPLLKPIHVPIHLSQLTGQVIGIDTYAWLHRGAYSCALDLLLENPTQNHIKFCLNRLQMLLDHGITPYFVFDGDYLPSKAKTESLREQKRAENKKRVLEFLKSNRKKEAHDLAKGSIDITPFLASKLIEELKQRDITYVVAPYEADAQLAYLQRKGLISSIITEDSDLLAFGCDNVIYKLENNGAGTMISSSDIGNIPSFRNWTMARFRHSCDYLPSIRGVGLKGALKGLQKNKHWTGYEVLASWKKFGKLIDAPPVSQEYINGFLRADHTFLYQRVFCPIENEMLFLSEPKLGVEDLDFCGMYVEDEISIGVAQGILCPITKKRFDLMENEEVRFVSDGEVNDSEREIILGDGCLDLENMPINVIESPKKPFADSTILYEERKPLIQRSNTENVKIKTTAKKSSFLKNVQTNIRKNIPILKVRNTPLIKSTFSSSPFFFKLGGKRKSEEITEMFECDENSFSLQMGSKKAKIEITEFCVPKQADFVCHKSLDKSQDLELSGNNFFGLGLEKDHNVENYVDDTREEFEVSKNAIETDVSVVSKAIMSGIKAKFGRRLRGIGLSKKQSTTSLLACKQ